MERIIIDSSTDKARKFEELIMCMPSGKTFTKKKIDDIIPFKDATFSKYINDLKRKSIISDFNVGGKTNLEKIYIKN